MLNPGLMTVWAWAALTASIPATHAPSKRRPMRLMAAPPKRFIRSLPARLALGSCLQRLAGVDGDFDASIELTPRIGVVGGDGLVLSPPDRLDTAIDAALVEIAGRGLGATLGQVLVVVRGPDRVRMADDHEVGIRILAQAPCELVEVA